MNIITINKGKGKEDMKVRKIIACILTFMVIFMNVHTNVFAVDVEKELINKDSKDKREYAIVRNHNGKVEILEGSYDEKSHTYTFETERFSDYAIIYKDTKEDNSDKKNDEVVDKDDKKKEEVVNKDESTSNNQETVKPTVEKETKKVKTGDKSNSIFYLGLIGVSLLGIYCLIMKKFTH